MQKEIVFADRFMVYFFDEKPHINEYLEHFDKHNVVSKWFIF
jgi:hypothetical protein